MEVLGLPIEVVRKDIKNLHVGVYPPGGRVRVAAPLCLNDDAVRLAIISRLGWIRRQQARFEQQTRQSQRELAYGESHYFGGRRYRLKVVEQGAAPRICLATNSLIELRVPPGTGRVDREAALHQWYRERIREQIPALLRKWQTRIGVEVAEVRVRRMKTRWGSCNSPARRVWLNLELAKKPAACLEYILVHEMVHIRERHHNWRFRQLMDAAMPTWRLYRDELNRGPLAHENWKY